MEINYINYINEEKKMKKSEKEKFLSRKIILDK